MTLVWIIVAVASIYFLVLLCGKWLLNAVAAVAAIVYTPIKETVRLKRNGETKKAKALGWSFGFAVAMIGLLIGLLIAMPK